MPNRLRAALLALLVAGLACTVPGFGPTPTPVPGYVGRFDCSGYEGGLLAYDLSDPANPLFLDYINAKDSGLVAPESLLFISAADSPTGGNLLLTGYEGIDGLSNYGIGVFAVVPVPPALVLFGGALAALGAVRRRRAAA